MFRLTSKLTITISAVACSVAIYSSTASAECFVLQNKATHSVLNSKRSGDVFTSPMNGSVYQTWCQGSPTDSYFLTNRGTRMVLDTNEAGSELFTNDYIDYTDTVSKKWADSTAGGGFNFIAHKKSGHCLESKGEMSASIAECNGSDQQKWKMIPANYP